MQNGIEEQIRFLIAVFLSGMLCGLVYDVFRARRKLLRLSNIYVNAEDVIFLIITGIIFLAVTFYLNSGVIRVSGFFGLRSGELVYFLLFRNHVRNFLIFLAKKIYKLLIIILRILFLPIKIIIRLFKKPVYIAAWYAGGRIKKTKSKLRIFKNIIKNRIKLINLFVKKKAKKH